MKYALSVKQSLLFADLSFIGSSKAYFKKSLRIDYCFTECLIREDDMFWNYDNDLLYNRALLKHKTLNQAITQFVVSLENSVNELEQTTKIITSRALPIKKETLKPIFESYIQAYLGTMPFLFLFWNTETMLMNQLKLDFTFLFGEEKSTALLQDFLIPSRPTFFSKERRSFAKIARFYSKNPSSTKLQSMVTKHIKQFAFTSFVLHLGKPLDSSVIMKRLQEKSSQTKQADHTSGKTRKNYKQIALFPEIYDRITLAQKLLFWKNQRLNILFKSDFQIKPLYEVIASSMELSYEEFVYLRYHEIIRWFTTDKLPAKAIIKKRMMSYALYLHNNRITFYIEKNQYPKIREERESIKTQLADDSIQGTTAYAGKVIGTVRIIKYIEDIHTLQAGEILVTSMTRPEMIIGLEKAAGFITDQGGMLSHAAIVSREMKKPCIVGTKNATTLLHNGDLVEVNANEGKIKIISK